MFTFTSTEKQELLIAIAVFWIVELSSTLYLINIQLIDLLILSLLIIPLFLFHELGHKFVAQGFGLYSEFRLYPNLALLSLVSVLLPIKIIAPGVVSSSGTYNLDIPARISMAGPIINIILGAIFLVSAAFTNTYWFFLLLFVSKVSFDLALFNLLPFSVFDGAKVFRWNEMLFLLLFGITLILWIFHPLGILGGIFL